jgi:hypothetical protein
MALGALDRLAAAGATSVRRSKAVPQLRRAPSGIRQLKWPSKTSGGRSFPNTLATPARATAASPRRSPTLGPCQSDVLDRDDSAPARRGLAVSVEDLNHPALPHFIIGEEQSRADSVAALTLLPRSRGRLLTPSLALAPRSVRHAPAAVGVRYSPGQQYSASSRALARELTSASLSRIRFIA